MNKIIPAQYFCVLENAVDTQSWVCDAQDVLRDIKFFIRESYVGFYSETGESLVVKFNNGQKFRISVVEIK